MTTPDFATMFPIDTSKDDRILTPRQASALWSALCVLSDCAYDDAESYGDEPFDPNTDDRSMMLYDLPRVTRKQSMSWRRNFARTADDLSGDLAAGKPPYPRCTAEEVALYLAWRRAKDDETLQVEGLPEHEDDENWDDLIEYLFQDIDFLLFWSNRADGFEDPEAELNKLNGIGDMRVANWFTWFNNAESRANNRGFRR